MREAPEQVSGLPVELALHRCAQKMNLIWRDIAGG